MYDHTINVSMAVEVNTRSFYVCLYTQGSIINPLSLALDKSDKQTTPDEGGRNMKIQREEEDLTEISIDEGEHLWIRTPQGNICIFIGKSGVYNTITSWVTDTHYTGFYTNNATKKTSACNEEVQHINLKPKED